MGTVLIYSVETLARISDHVWGFHRDPAAAPAGRSAKRDAGPSVERFDAPGGRLGCPATAGSAPAAIEAQPGIANLQEGVSCNMPITRPRTSLEDSNWIIVVANGQTMPRDTTPTSRKSIQETQNQLDQAKSMRSMANRTKQMNSER